MLLSACGGGSSPGSTSTINSTATSANNTAVQTSITASTVITPLLSYLNTLRTLAGLPTYFNNSQLEASATAHSIYQLANNVMSHDEDPAKVGFTGLNAADRAKYAKYFITSVSEDISFNKDTGEELIDGLMTAVYHRMGLLDFDKDEIGLGLVKNPKTTDGTLWSVLTTNSGLKLFNETCASGGELIQSGYYYLCNDGTTKVSAASYDQWHATLRAQSSDVIVWPPAGGTVPPSFYEESPDPLPECSISGNPVSVQVNPANNTQIQLDLASFSLKEKLTGNVIPLFRTLSNLSAQPDPIASHWQNNSQAWFAAFPTLRLNWGTTYQASINYTFAGTVITKSWEFSTQALSQTPIVLTQNTMTVSAPGQSKFVIYVPPGDCKAGTTQLASNAVGSNPLVSLQSIDAHTFTATVSGASQFTLTFTQVGNQTYTKILTINL